MKSENVIVEKTFQFGLRVVKLFFHLRNQKVERELCIQLLKSGTSVGANVEEALGGSSKKDFTHKLEIAYREARETHYWLRLLNQSGLLDDNLATSFLFDNEAILKILSSIIRTSKSAKKISTQNY